MSAPIDVDVDNVWRLLWALIEGHVPQDRRNEAYVLAALIEVDVRREARRCYDAGREASGTTTDAAATTPMIHPDGFFVELGRYMNTTPLSVTEYTPDAARRSLHAMVIAADCEADGAPDKSPIASVITALERRMANGTARTH